MLASATALSCESDKGRERTEVAAASQPRTAGIVPATPSANVIEAPRPPQRPTITIPAGSYKVGVTDRKDLHPVEGLPSKTVRLEAFELDVREVAVSDYRRCVADGACSDSGLTSEPECNWNNAARSNHPMNCLSFEQAATYCRWERKRLPSEEEWETAARRDGLGGRGKYAWALERACFKCQKENGVPEPADPAPKGTCPVGTYRIEESKLGFSDLVGNVAEWTTGRFCTWKEPMCSAPVVRGNTWCSTMYEELTERRPGSGVANGRGPTFVGFRCARDASSDD
jgi:formylglycine-generating enzyme